VIGAAALSGACAAAAAQWADCIGSVVCDLPINHIGFLGDLVGTALVAGSTVILEPRFDPARTCELLVAERITAWTGVPAMFAATLAVLPDDADLSALRRVLYGGASMPDAVLSALRARTPAPVTGVYGSTETVANVAAAEQGRDSGGPASRASLGRAVAPYALRVDSPTAGGGAWRGRRDPGPDAVRVHRLPGRARGVRRAWTGDGWLRTGDLGRWRRTEPSPTRESGQLVQDGRLLRQPGRGRGAAPRAARGPGRGRHGGAGRAARPVPAAMVVAPGAEPGAVRDLLRDRLAGYKVPRTVVVVDALPLLPLGKTDRAAVTRTLQARDDGAPR
jgi:acyl-CoA synthetase (AMP-forming)/AMP-acid ligase II